MRIFNGVNYDRKVLFNKILSAELSKSSFEIEAFYETAPQEQIMSAQISNDRTINLGINTSFKSEYVFSDCLDSMGLSIAYRAYFIATYIYCIENAKEMLPTSFFSGVVNIEAIFDLFFGDKVNCFSPYLFSKNRNLRSIDVYCAIRAMRKVMLNYSDSFSKEAKRACETYIDAMLVYSSLPEIEYSRSKYAKYTVFCETEKLKSLVLQYPEVLSECNLFSQCSFISIDNLTVIDLLEKCNDIENGFWSGLVMRMLILGEKNRQLKKFFEHPAIINSCLEFSANAFEFYSEMKNLDPKNQMWLLKDNWKAIEQLIKGFDKQSLLNASCRSGLVHYLE